MAESSWVRMVEKKAALIMIGRHDSSASSGSFPLA